MNAALPALPDDESLTNSTEFTYTTLTNPDHDLRLLSILPGSHGSTVQIIMDTHCMDPAHSPPAYRALSYAWGDATDTVPMTVNGKLFRATRNLEKALGRLRNARHFDDGARYEDNLIWADAICINQKDQVERYKQVQRMGDTYSQAEEVVIWLGDFVEPADSPFRPPNTLPEVEYRKALPWASTFVKDSKIPSVRDKSHVSKAGNENHTGEHTATHRGSVSTKRKRNHSEEEINAIRYLTILLARPWFDRLWVVQEKWLARRAIVLLGDMIVPWSILQETASIIERDTPIVESTLLQVLYPLMKVNRLLNIVSGNTSNDSSDNILSHLHRLQHAQCSDPRDKLFAILALCNHESDIIVDYSSSADQVYTTWAASRIQRTKCLDILNICVHSDQERAFPSWVPDLRYSVGQDSILWKNSVLRTRTWLQDRTTEYARLQSDKLLVKGHLVSRIGWLGPHCISPESRATPVPFVSAELRGLENIMIKEGVGFNRKLFKSEDCREMLRRTIHRESVANAEEGGAALLKQKRELWESFMEPLTSFAKILLEPRFKGFGLLMPTLKTCKLFATEIFSQLGIVANNCAVQRGDEIWLLVGGSSAFILRPVEGNEKQLIGPCYLGDECGDVMRMEPENSQLEEIVII